MTMHGVTTVDARHLSSSWASCRI